MTPIHAVVQSPAVANTLAKAGVETAEAAALLTDGQLLRTKGVGPSALSQIRAWQLAQEPPIALPATDPSGADEAHAPVYRDPEGMRDDFRAFVRHYLRTNPPEPVDVATRESSIDALAERLYERMVLFHEERQTLADFKELRATAYEAASVFFPVPSAPESEQP